MLLLQACCHPWLGAVAMGSGIVSMHPCLEHKVSALGEVLGSVWPICPWSGQSRCPLWVSGHCLHQSLCGRARGSSTDLHPTKRDASSLGEGMHACAVCQSQAPHDEHRQRKHAPRGGAINPCASIVRSWQCSIGRALYPASETAPPASALASFKAGTWMAIIS